MVRKFRMFFGWGLKCTRHCKGHMATFPDFTHRIQTHGGLRDKRF